MPYALLFLSLLAVPKAVHAAQLAEALSTRDLVEAAANTVHGVVDDVVASRADDGRIISQVTVRVFRSVPRQPGDTFTFSLTGGVLDGVRLHVPGHPVPVVGDEVLVFERAGKLIGQGQGLFVNDGSGWTRPGMPTAVGGGMTDIDSVLGNESQSSACARETISIGQHNGWAPRAAVASTLRPGTTRALSMNVLAGVSYRLTVCDGGQVQALQGALYDSSDRPVDPTSDAAALEWRFTPQETGQYILGVEASAFREQTHRTAVSVILEFQSNP